MTDRVKISLLPCNGKSLNQTAAIESTGEKFTVRYSIEKEHYEVLSDGTWETWEYQPAFIHVHPATHNADGTPIENPEQSYWNFCDWNLKPWLKKGDKKSN